MMLACWLRHRITVASVAVELGQLAGGTKHRFGMTCLLRTARRSPSHSTSVTFVKALRWCPAGTPNCPFSFFLQPIHSCQFFFLYVQTGTKLHHNDVFFLSFYMFCKMMPKVNTSSQICRKQQRMGSAKQDVLSAQMT